MYDLLVAQRRLYEKGIYLFFGVFGALGVFWLIMDIALLITSHFQAKYWGNLVGDLIWPILPLALFSWMGYFLLVPDVRRRSALQWAALYRSGEGVPLAAPQPAPDIAALALPFVIRLRPRWSFFLVYGLCLPLLAAAVAIRGLLKEEDSTLFAIVLFAFGLVIMLPVSLLLERRTLFVTEDGIGYRNIDEVEMLRWNDVQLLAVTGGNNRRALAYQLSSSRQVIRWTRQMRSSRFMLIRPTMPFEVYDAQMWALLSVVDARTGLPLYDLR